MELCQHLNGISLSPEEQKRIREDVKNLLGNLFLWYRKENLRSWIKFINNSVICYWQREKYLWFLTMFLSKGEQTDFRFQWFLWFPVISGIEISPSPFFLSLTCCNSPWNDDLVYSIFFWKKGKGQKQMFDTIQACQSKFFSSTPTHFWQ
jgi:hypothetical protein